MTILFFATVIFDFVYTHETGHCLLCLLNNNSKNVLFCSIITSSDIIIIDLTISGRKRRPLIVIVNVLTVNVIGLVGGTR